MIHVDASREAVWAVLSNAYTYDHWVVGCKEIRGVDGVWPEPGATFHHSVGMGPITIKDSTSVTASDAPRRLVLRARARPTGIVRVEIDLAAAGDGTEVVMTEVPVEGPPAMLHNPLQDWLIDRRNREALRRLKQLAERA
jgi:carbon monoxide dehydrogenase subunit G